MSKKSALGRGLGSLIPAADETPADTATESDGTKYLEIDIDLIEPNPHQPRRRFEKEPLEQLAESIKHNGIIQPVIVAKKDKRYMLIAGERRWRAAQLAGYQKVPAVLREIEDDQMLTLALLENIQRQELNPIEEAQAYQSLIEDQDFTQESLAEKLGKSRVSISNTIRLLRLPAYVRDLIEDGALSFGHARCLITVNDKEKLEELVKNCINKGWSVRELERHIKQEKESGSKAPKPSKDVFLKNAEVIMSKAIGTKISISGNEKKGKIQIPYTSEDELQRIFEWLTKQESVEE